MKRLIRWLRWRRVEIVMILMFWRLRLAGFSPEEAYDEVKLIARKSGLIVAKDGGDPWPHMQAIEKELDDETRRATGRGT